VYVWVGGGVGHCCYYIELISLNNASSHVYSHTLRACLDTHGYYWLRLEISPI
jgi:hypothetical protein